MAAGPAGIARNHPIPTLIFSPEKQRPRKPDALSRFVRPATLFAVRVQRPLLLFGFLGQIIDSFAGMAHQYGARASNLAQSLEVGLHLESGSLEP